MLVSPLPIEPDSVTVGRQLARAWAICSSVARRLARSACSCGLELYADASASSNVCAIAGNVTPANRVAVKVDKKQRRAIMAQTNWQTGKMAHQAQRDAQSQ